VAWACTHARVLVSPQNTGMSTCPCHPGFTEPGHGFARAGVFEYPSARMIRALQLVDLEAGFQAERGAAVLARELGSGFEVRTRTISRGGGLAGVASVVGELRRDAVA